MCLPSILTLTLSDAMYTHQVTQNNWSGMIYIIILLAQSHPSTQSYRSAKNLLHYNRVIDVPSIPHYVYEQFQCVDTDYVPASIEEMCTHTLHYTALFGE